MQITLDLEEGDVVNVHDIFAYATSTTCPVAIDMKMASITRR